MPTKQKKPVTRKKSTAKSKKRPLLAADTPMQTLKLSRKDLPFFSIQITKQTIYWSILLIFVLVLQLWILNVQLDVVQTLDSINENL